MQRSSEGYFLRGVDPAGREIERELMPGELTIGRASDADLVLDDPQVSRRHAMLVVRDGALIVRDAGSSNGTFVNGERVTESELTLGDTLAIGPAVLTVASRQSPPADLTRIAASAEGTLVIDRTMIVAAPAPPPPAAPPAPPAPP